MLKQYIVIILLGIELCAYAKSAVTYTFSGGRFGDNLVAYCHAKWISYKYNIPLLYRPFEYSNQLIMHSSETLLLGNFLHTFRQIIFINHPDFNSIDPEADILYVIPYFPESPIELEYARFFYHFEVDWKDPGFKAELQRMICPINKREKIRQENDGISIGLHVRIGTGFDIPTIQVFFDQPPDGASHLKFPPLTYYIEQLKRCIQMYPDTHLTVYLFTDHTNPQELADIFKNAVSCERMHFIYRVTNNRHNLHVLDDFFALTEFDCLIRPDANFSLVASKLGNYQLLIYPLHGIIENNKNVIDRIVVERNY